MIAKPATFQELLHRWMHADASMVQSFNEEHIAERAPISVELAFTNARLSNVATALATVLQMLAEETDGK